MRVLHNLLKIKVLAFSLLISAGAFAGDRVVERSFSFGGGQLLEVDVDGGHVQIRTGSGSQVVVRVEAKRGAVSDYVDLSFDEGQGLRVRARERRDAPRSGGVNFEIQAPRFMDLVVHTGGGHLEVGDVDGYVTAETGGGHITLGNVGGDLDAQTGGGHIQSGQVDGRVRMQTGGGHVNLEDAEGDVEVRTGGGHIEVHRVNGDLFARTGGGHVKAGEVTGNLEVKTSGGHVQARRCRGDAEVRTSGGEIILEDMEGYILADTGGGDIRVSLASGNQSGADLHSDDDGDITIELPDDEGYDIEASAAGIVETDVNVVGKRRNGSLEGSIGRGGATIKARAEDGDIRILRR